MTSNPKLYDKVVLREKKSTTELPGTKTYKGFSTITPSTNNFSVYDYALIKQDLINHFHIRQGERLENPTFGTIIWDVLFEPLTDQLISLITQDVQNIINYDPRLVAEQVIVTTYDQGLQIDCSLRYLPYNITESLQLKFDRESGIFSQ